jgi:hypothetical protein
VVCPSCRASAQPPSLDAVLRVFEWLEDLPTSLVVIDADVARCIRWADVTPAKMPCKDIFRTLQPFKANDRDRSEMRMTTVRDCL